MRLGCEQSNRPPRITGRRRTGTTSQTPQECGSECDWDKKAGGTLDLVFGFGRDFFKTVFAELFLESAVFAEWLPGGWGQCVYVCL